MNISPAHQQRAAQGRRGRPSKNASIAWDVLESHSRDRQAADKPPLTIAEIVAQYLLPGASAPLDSTVRSGCGRRGIPFAPPPKPPRKTDDDELTDAQRHWASVAWGPDVSWLLEELT